MLFPEYVQIRALLLKFKDLQLFCTIQPHSSCIFYYIHNIFPPALVFNFPSKTQAEATKQSRGIKNLMALTQSPTANLRALCAAALLSGNVSGKGMYMQIYTHQLKQQLIQ